MNRKSRVETEEKREERNWWRWAFIGLLVVIVLLGGYGYSQLTAQPPVNQEQGSFKPSEAQFEINLDKGQINALAANYLGRLQKGKAQKYMFKIGKFASISGKQKILGQNINFAINFIPKKTKEGNVLLKAKGLNIGRLNLPIPFAMTYVREHYKIPKWVSINSHKKTILLDLNKYSRNKTLRYSVKKINMESDQFTIKVSVPK
ncbi:YpmS family protein [Pediococcus claussenii]|uniref:DUF2140 family protein n=1 Tax=Pediococcus claussenii (strain ATCC BAA-344 / DSM 14800 / JCM 18046 / KCTC 3811 / LMG 21948 / P06) TaxID=701521 RepID=G8PD55_PEDCP|nr:YpmS family protein [Pediococcus claussenii]AEV95190.1 hypothetical protein PECL_921 [Pediococcus claussenii ATCC BAA-344]ANZ70421.1 hypothetical protein AYR57_08870 [Pediococcus claussenii]ANZ72237.1 hypothetical protein AYR58_08870 [Pediococcus claussenii]KRN19627.1 hypothetical protein IV79_GL001344 [Pediococcus claussenii]